MSDPVPSGREVLERVTTATGDWQLQRRGGHYQLICSGVFLMSSDAGQTERDLARLALARVAGDRLRVLVGGLGIGYTAQAVLSDLRVSRLDIVEIEPVVITWHRRYFAPICGCPLDDPRSRLIEADLHDLPLGPGSYDAILLDTDNGPQRLSRGANDRLYQEEAQRKFRQALTVRGVLGVWTPEGVRLVGA